MDRITALSVFSTIVEQGSLSGAADKLDISRAKVSRYLAELEAWMDTRLLHRTTRRLSLTSAGEETLNVAHQLLGMAETLENIRSQHSSELKGQLRLTASLSLTESFLIDAVGKFIETWPQTSVDILTTDDPVNLIESRIDLAIRITNDLEPNVVAKRIGECRSVVCASPEYIKKRGKPVDVQSLAYFNCLSFAYYGKAAWVFDGPNGPESVVISGTMSSNLSEVLLAATIKGHGISLQPVAAAKPLVASGQLIELLTEWEPKPLGVYIVYANRKQITPLQRGFIDFLAKEMKASPYW
ncbi:LysR family transcriptional regulator [Vibrio cincinnatiensis]|uniref:LysR family transcriptional regulator n=1 Tax=Vibrio cincinnatiensis TaxID=675 RepID=UPI0012AD1C58|nr:LysR family transcriptional regulator [Vibrio cincinnatiensis]MCG3724771.1 LysR family transcriptional regulator [Vibrio cincinnatiensis]MCG3743227.1 LysR family transcriptional regulator [Vibrio cincinnatiensis]MCG3748283.1 LysR family transcriptional regulator [Vibrio cincinnatiensis]